MVSSWRAIMSRCGGGGLPAPRAPLGAARRRPPPASGGARPRRGAHAARASGGAEAEASSPPCDSGYCSLEGWRRPLGGDADGDGGLGACVALGKFDGLHRGHRELAAAAAAMGGRPWLVSFAGIAAVLGWPARLPLVAPPDRRRVLAGWAPACRGRRPRECAIPFADIRRLDPEAFVRLLAEELGVAGVAVGENYRFGYRAAGTAAMLEELGRRHGLRVAVVGLVGTGGGGAVSSSAVRAALAAGDVAAAGGLMGRPYRLVADLSSGVAPPRWGGDGSLLLPPGCLLNQPPAAGEYAAAAAAGDDACARACTVEVGAGGGLAVRLPGARELLGAGGGALSLDFGGGAAGT